MARNSQIGIAIAIFIYRKYTPYTEKDQSSKAVSLVVLKNKMNQNIGKE